jgi:flagellar secretion chaperone FliS
MTNVRTAYREADAGGANSVRLVVLLYEQLIQDLSQAAKAMEQNNVEYRTNRINHALDILCVLEGTLNFERGGQVARNLEGFYKTLRANLWKAQLHMSKETLIRQITDLFALREAWAEVDRAESAGSVPKVTPMRAAAPDDSSDQLVPVSWRA